MNIIGKRKIWYLISLATIILGVLFLSIYQVQFGIDFTGGTILELRGGGIKTEIVNQVAKEVGVENPISTPTSDDTILIRAKSIDEKKKQEVVDKLKDRVGEVSEVRFETVGPTISKELTKKAILSVVLASVAIILYIAWAFRRVSKPVKSWVYGAIAVLALLHDLVVTTGLFAIASRFFGYEVDSLFITALLTVMGFSIHDTIVVFDRTRENLRLHPQLSFEEVVNESVVQTFARSLSTSLTVLLTLSALFLLGGETIRGFVYTLFVGIFVGTYSSIFIASPALVTWNNFLIKRKEPLLHHENE